jgi:hypothetical protein
VPLLVVASDILIQQLETAIVPEKSGGNSERMMECGTFGREIAIVTEKTDGISERIAGGIFR